MIKWIKPKNKNAEGADVSISFYSGNGRKFVRISLSKSTKESIAGKTNKIIFGVEKGRLYFKADASGCKLTANRNRYVTQSSTDPAIFIPFVGHHDVVYDSQTELFFIKETEEEY